MEKAARKDGNVGNEGSGVRKPQTPPQLFLYLVIVTVLVVPFISLLLLYFSPLSSLISNLTHSLTNIIYTNIQKNLPLPEIPDPIIFLKRNGKSSLRTIAPLVSDGLPCPPAEFTHQ